jgi:hypothetical protein
MRVFTMFRDFHHEQKSFLVEFSQIKFYYVL